MQPRYQVTDADSLFKALVLVDREVITDYYQLDFSHLKWHARIHGLNYHNSLNVTLMEVLINFQRYLDKSYIFCKYWDFNKKPTKQDLEELKEIKLDFLITEGSLDLEAITKCVIDIFSTVTNDMTPKHKLTALLILASALLGGYGVNCHYNAKQYEIALRHDLKMKEQESNEKRDLVDLAKLAIEISTNTRRELFRASIDAESIDYGGRRYNKQEILQEASRPNISSEAEPTTKTKKFEVLSISTRHTEIINSDLSKARRQQTTRPHELELLPLEAGKLSSPIKMSVSEKALSSTDFFTHEGNHIIYITYSSIKSKSGEESKICFHEFVSEEIYIYLRGKEHDVSNRVKPKIVYSPDKRERQLSMELGE